MNLDKRKYTYMALVALVAIAALYVTYSLIKDGSPTVKSQNEYLVEANRLHNDSLFEAAVEPYMKAAGFDAQQSLVNYNTATNTIMKNHTPLSKSFNEEGYKLDASIDSALVNAVSRLEKAGEEQPDTAKYSSIYHNMGVTNHMRNNLDAAAEAYKEALRKNPADEDARYNLAVILHQKKNEQQQNQEQNQQNQQQQEQQKEQEQKEQEKEQQDKQQEKEQEQKEKEQQNQQQQQQQQRDSQEDKEQIEQMLKALMQDEKEIREKMEEAEKVKVKANSIDKNW
ncbi:MAG: tetratricopeptide repeat protein [Bacteroidaceae bacterium]|nr:tetratricopeptide repeat protein [Bacteroidaceae bacterium]